MYLEAKDNIPGELESLFEIGFYLIGRKFIFVISGIILVLSYGESIARLHVVGKILQSLIKSLFYSTPGSITSDFDLVVTNTWFSVFAITLLVLAVCLKKEMQEMYVIALSLFIALVVFILMMFYQVLSHHETFAIANN